MSFNHGFNDQVRSQEIKKYFLTTSHFVHTMTSLSTQKHDEEASVSGVGGSLLKLFFVTS